MKHLKHHTLIFDEACPLCRTYTKAFVKTGMLDENGREAYQRMNSGTCAVVDKDRARNEIALVNRETGEVLYGIDSLFKVLSGNYPSLKLLFNCNPFRYAMSKLYSFISYNRKVIMPSGDNDSCKPDLNISYRIAYLFSTWLLSSLILTFFSKNLVGVVQETKFLREFIICGGQIIFQSAIVFFISPKKVLDYLGNMMTISFAASLLLLIIHYAFHFAGIASAPVYATAFMLIVALMFAEHMRRMKLLQLSIVVSAGWVVYRLIVLIIIL